jgi:hypothetical protein
MMILSYDEALGPWFLIIEHRNEAMRLLATEQLDPCRDRAGQSDSSGDEPLSVLAENCLLPFGVRVHGAGVGDGL